MTPEERYTIGELATLAGVTPRTIRYYVSIGLLPPPGQVGPGARYGDGHLARLRLIRKLQREHLPLGEIGTRLAGLHDDAVEQALEAVESPVAPGSALDYIKHIKAASVPVHRALRRSTAAEPAAMTRALEALPMTPSAAPAPGEPMQAQRSQWERVALSQNVELHIRRPLGRLDHKRVERLIRIGREILEEGDQP